MSQRGFDSPRPHPSPGRLHDYGLVIRGTVCSAIIPAFGRA